MTRAFVVTINLEDYENPDEVKDTIEQALEPYLDVQSVNIWNSPGESPTDSTNSTFPTL